MFAVRIRSRVSIQLQPKPSHNLICRSRPQPVHENNAGSSRQRPCMHRKADSNGYGERFCPTHGLMSHMVLSGQNLPRFMEYVEAIRPCAARGGRLSLSAEVRWYRFISTIVRAWVLRLKCFRAIFAEIYLDDGSSQAAIGICRRWLRELGFDIGRVIANVIC